MFGDSAGGGLIASSILKMRDEGLGMPAAVVLWSPWLDLTGNGDTYFTLTSTEPNHGCRNAYPHSGYQKDTKR
jgi:monoterpene epsilon-lactone hydrolase